LQIDDTSFDLAKCLFVVKRVYIYIAHIEGAQFLEYTHLHLLTIVPAENRGLTNGIRPQPGARAKRHQAIERDTQHGQIDLFLTDFRNVRQTTEGPDSTDRGSIN
jgi:hypothetical protein